jgi:DNA-binding LacI/PurR family transcriptional regulator
MSKALSNETPSKKIANQIAQKICSGEWKVGSSLPSTRALAVEFGASPNTVQRAFGVLENQGLVERSPWRGRVVKARLAGNLMAGQQAMQIAAIMPTVVKDGAVRENDDWGSRIIRSAEATMSQEGYHISMLSYHYQDANATARLLSQIDRLAGQLVGVIMFVRSEIEPMLNKLDKRNIPWLTINPVCECVAHNFVTADNFNGGRLVGRLFAELNYERVIYFGGAMQHGNSSGTKFHGLVQGYLEGGKPLHNIDFVMCDDVLINAGAEGLRAYVARNGVPHAILTAGDILAAEAIRVCQEAGYLVPQDVGVIGATNLSMAEYFRPSLTVLAQPMEEIGRAAAEMLREMIHNKTRRLPGRFVPSPLIVRSSFAVPTDLLARITAEVARGGLHSP